MQQFSKAAGIGSRDVGKYEAQNVLEGPFGVGVRSISDRNVRDPIAFNPFNKTG